MRRLWCLPIVLVLASCVTGVPLREAAQTYYDLGNAYSRLGEQDKATNAYLRALQIDSSLFQASYNLARVYIDSGQYPKALTLLGDLLAKDPTNTITLATFGYAYFKQNDLDKAMSYYEQILAISPADKNALFNEAAIYEKQGKNAVALDTFQKLYDLTSDYTLLSHMGLLELAMDDRVDGIRFLEAYREKKPDDIDILVALGGAYQKEELYDRALDSYDAALALKASAPDVLFAKATILLTGIEDEDAGFKALTAAIDAGFADKKKLQSLVDNPNLTIQDKVRSYLRDKKLLADAAATSQTSSPAAGN